MLKMVPSMMPTVLIRIIRRVWAEEPCGGAIRPVGPRLQFYGEPKPHFEWRSHFIEQRFPGFSNCKFIRNGTLANNHGGAVKMLGSSSSFSDAYSRDATQTNSGGAIYADASSSPLHEQRIHFNYSVQFGGAIFAESNEFRGRTFSYAILVEGCSVSCSFSNMRILGNESIRVLQAVASLTSIQDQRDRPLLIGCYHGNKSLGRNGVYRPTGATVS